jgi:phosphoribosylformimino-5-aminoimidazole carboxamide ribotide isomerase
MAEATIFNDDPAAQARSFEAQGFDWLHIVDLDGAFAGKPVNKNAIESILKAVSIPVQLGGGIRDLATIEMWLEAGVRRVILGTAAVKSPELVKEACRNGRVATEGWAETSSATSVGLAQRLCDAGVAAVIYTDIDRDGLLSGINIESTLVLAKAIATPVIASGGLASLADIERLLEPDCAIFEGVIAGRALYDGRLDAAAALRLIREAA